MANGIMADGTANGTADETAKLGRQANAAEIFSEIQTASHLVLPSNAIIAYMNEGAANIVFSLTIPRPHQDPENSYRTAVSQSRKNRDGFGFWDGKLLRLRKELPWAAPCAIAQANFLVHIYPLFRSEHLVQQHLVEVKTSGIVRKLNRDLVELEKISAGHNGSCRIPRPAKRQGRYLADDNHGLLVEDMTPLRASDVELIEFKPKWLTQSRSAPEYSKRCRGCAQRARTNAARIREGSNLPLVRRFCPLDLVSKDDTARYRAVCAILAINDPVSTSDFKRIHLMSQWACTSPLLSRLASLQANLDPHGVFDADPTDTNFLTAMTLRDCSLYLQLPLHDLSAPIIAKIGDLDLKRPEKAEYWKDVERPLLEEGWYMGTESEGDRQPLDCNLFPEHWTPRPLQTMLRPKRWSDSVTEVV